MILSKSGVGTFLMTCLKVNKSQIRTDTFLKLIFEQNLLYAVN